MNSSRIAPKVTVGDDRPHAVYDFDLINRAKTLRGWTELSDIRSRHLVPGSSMNVLTIHNSPRSLRDLTPRACGARRAAEVAKLLLRVRATLAGEAIPFKGEESGLEQPEVADEEVRDPRAKALWPDVAGRDGVRGPIPWVAGARFAGFSEAECPRDKAAKAHR